MIDYDVDAGVPTPEQAFADFLRREYHNAPPPEEWISRDGHPERVDHVWEYDDPATSKRIARISVVQRSNDRFVVESFALCDPETKHW